MVPGEDDSYLQFGAELEDKESNDRNLGDTEEEPLFYALDERYTQSSGSIGKERATSQDDSESRTVRDGLQWKTGGNISGRRNGMNDIVEATVTVADIHPGLTPTQEKHPLPDQSSTEITFKTNELGDCGLKVVATTVVGTTLKGVSTLGGGHENDNESKENTGRNQDH